RWSAGKRRGVSPADAHSIGNRALRNKWVQSKTSVSKMETLALNYQRKILLGDTRCPESFR
ncbi:MAG TPA: hypothetical protein VFM75_00710, partial [Modicisalibacter sp.]|nr:hypothetical protein [Modicisalibacter sp.]